MHPKYSSDLEAFTNHCNRCHECLTNPFGFCAAGFRLLRAAAKFTNDGQLPLFPVHVQEKLNTPLVRSYLRR